LGALVARAPNRIAAYFDFTHARERQLLAGADVLLMPSLYEPCGLTQMRALRYGTLPVARRVGGLADTIEDQVTGFLFDAFEPVALERGLKRAFGLFDDSEAWRRHMREAMARDFSWNRSVERYLEVYESAFERRSRQA
jgi:starch synthase